MRSTPMWIILGCSILLFGGTANAWGGLFNRFSPEILDNMGYGNHGGGYNSFLQNEVYVEDQGSDDCWGHACATNADCCPGFICYHPGSDVGKCIAPEGRKLGEICRVDSDCEAGLMCDSAGPNGATICQAPIMAAKQYAEDCNMSNECDITRGLCCQLQRRHRQAPRKACLYFKDPLLCIGSVSMSQIKHHVQHTIGEKRLTSAFKNGLY